MTKAPDPGFPFWSEASCRRRPLAEILEELRHELEHREETYPRLVTAGRMTDREAAQQIGALAAICTEIAWILADRHQPRPLNALTWSQKINCLRREIMIRRHRHPELVNSGRLTLEDAEHKLELLECAHAWYWNHGRDFMEPAPAGEHRYANFRNEEIRRWFWAIGRGLDPRAPEYLDAGDWECCPPLDLDRTLLIRVSQDYLPTLTSFQIVAILDDIDDRRMAA